MNNDAIILLLLFLLLNYHVHEDLLVVSTINWEKIDKLMMQIYYEFN